jgi:hypothetical protein
MLLKKNTQTLDRQFTGLDVAGPILVHCLEKRRRVTEEVAEKLNYFQKMHAQPATTLCDIRDLYKHVTFRDDGPKARLFNNLNDYRFENNAIQNSIWKNLISFVHGYGDLELPDLLAYQKQRFASPSARNETLIPLYPLPSSHHHGWYYSWLDLPQFPFLKSRTLYQEHVYQRRMQTILSSIRAYKPELVMMYGMDNINALKQSVQEFFPGARFSMIKATKQQIPQHHRAVINGTILLITTQIPALRHNRIESDLIGWSLGKG